MSEKVVLAKQGVSWQRPVIRAPAGFTTSALDTGHTSQSLYLARLAKPTRMACYGILSPVSIALL